ncbi:hypothetical protein CCMSSC00406_0006326 [Pleurotus cornucopiae]|uniref:Uncharacterized protein n=1 Tax=Pleurotus cornucopiae TaxID=5321 RepID=A0ACB7IRK1_PLECO|nr:hypothetical protein CCMSSC00406_0006326 [Pleurotus cornucopiae]
MSDFESLFNSSILKVSVPDTSIEFPPKGSTDEWLARLNSGSAERKQAFFDEQLHALVTLRINLPLSDTPVSQDKPPPELLSFLAHLQTTVEATYISSVPTALPDTPDTTRLSAPPRTGSLGLKITSRPGSQHPSIYPPNTPNPTPLTADHDRKYVQAEGTLLTASIWGQSADEESGEAFRLLWSEEEQVWVAVYRLGLRISFVSLKFDDPLLCLTVSETLREKSISLHQYPKHPLAAFLAAHGAIAPSTEVPLPSPRDKPTVTDENELNGLDEANILEGLACGPTYYTLSEDANALTLPTTRLGIVTRRKLFSLAPTSLPSPVAPSPSPLTALRTTHPTLRKSFRRTLGTASGFRVRMRTVFVPAVMLDEDGDEGGESDDTDADEQHAARDTPSGDDSDDSDEDEKAAEQKDLRESGNEERTVILSVEVENSGDSGPGVLFEVENVDVRIGGEGARSRLIGWGDGDAKSKEGSKFPIRIESMGQYNLLYAVSFLKTPNDMDGFSLSRDPSIAGAHNPELQRAVSITVYGRPIIPTGANKDGVYPTETFSSRWNCVLDLSASAANAQDQSVPRPDDLGTSSKFKDTLPEPPSPFPMSFSGARSPLPYAKGSSGSDSADRRASVPIRSPTSASIGGIGIAGVPKRHSLPGSQPGRIPSASGGWRSSTSMLNPGYQPARDLRPPNPISPGAGSSNANNRLSYMPPSVTVNVQNARSPTTYNAPYIAAAAPAAPFAFAHFDGSDDTRVTSPISITENGGMPPPTPAYPSYPSPSGLPVLPPSQNPIVSQNSGNVGPKIDVKRAKGVGLGVTLPGAPSPGGAVGGGSGSNTPLPLVPGAFGEQTMLRELQRAEESREAVVVSVGMLPVKRKHSLADALGGSSPDDQEEEPGKGTGPGKIYPLETFTLDIFVFNQSAWTRRLEVSFPDRRTGRKGALSEGARVKDWNGAPGILALDNRVRVGPLRPSTCQSVRMEFLALSPGVHSVDTLTLTDVESGISMNLRSVMDVVVHERFD